jgi:hypothetical protein
MADRCFISVSILLLLNSFLNPAFSQSGSSKTPVNAVGWYGYEVYHPFIQGKPWGLMSEAFAMRDNIITDPMQWFFRIGLNYQLSNGNRITGGYAYQYNIPYDETSEPYSWSDHRIWEQYLVRKPFKKNKKNMWMHRFRMEQRWLQRKASPDYTKTSNWDFQNTLRYQFRVNLAIRNKWSVNLNDEIFLRAPPPEAKKIVDQNWFYAGLVYYIDKKRLWRIEPGYMFQSTWNSPDDLAGRKRINHVFRLVITSDAAFSKH